jgi:hypothetical protein
MIRPNEITCVVLDDIYYWLNNYDYEEIELSEDKKYILIKAKKSYCDYLFNANIEYNDTTRIVQSTVQCLTSVPKDKRVFCLKLLNYIGYFEKEAKYLLCPDNKTISCAESYSILDSRCSIGQLIESHAFCSIDILTVAYDTIENNDVRICGFHPIRFHNYL